MPNQALGQPGGLISTPSVENKKQVSASPSRLKMRYRIFTSEDKVH